MPAAEVTAAAAARYVLPTVSKEVQKQCIYEWRQSGEIVCTLKRGPSGSILESRNGRKFEFEVDK